jgi:hypothetical protein
MFWTKVSGGLRGASEQAASGQPKQRARAIPMSLLMALMISVPPLQTPANDTLRLSIYRVGLDRDLIVLLLWLQNELSIFTLSQLIYPPQRGRM